MSTDYTVGDLVADFIPRCGVSTVFGIVSVHNIPMLDAIANRNTLRFVMARGEMGGGHMADGYARTSGGLGVLISSTGPGAANAVPGLVEAGFAGSPVLHITGQAPSGGLDREVGAVHQIRDQLGMLGSVCKAAYRVRKAEEAFGVLKRAAREAISAPSGPVSVEIPIDIQGKAIPRPGGLDSYVLAPAPVAGPQPGELGELVDMVSKARRPMIWAGRGAKHAGAPIARLLDKGFGLVTSWQGRGVVSEDHPRNLGGLHGPGSPVIDDFYKSVDLMLVVGSRLRGHETLQGALELPDNRVQIDIDPAADGRTYANNLFVEGDCALVLEALLDAAGDRIAPEDGYAAEFEAMKVKAQAAYKDTLGPYTSFPAQLREALPKDGIFARDITISHSAWGNRLFPLHGTRDSVYPVGAAIGPGMQLGIGAALGGGGRKCVAMCGDGGFLLNPSELWTAVQENVDITIIVMNDRGYGVIRHIQDAVYGGRRNYHDLLAPDFGKLAELAGVPFWKVDTADAFGDTVSKALATNGPTLIEVDMTAIGAFPPYYPYSPKKEAAGA